MTGLTLENGAGDVINAGTTATINGASTPVSYSLGGAIDNSGTLTVSQSTLTGNVAAGLYGYGGAIYNAGTLTLTSSTLSNNATADAASWGGGGAIYNAGSLSVTNSTLANNIVTNVSAATGLGNSPHACGGGGIDNLGTLTVADSTLAGNSAVTGGGIDSTSSASVSLLNTIVATNVADTGPDISGTVTGNNNLVGQNGALSGIRNGVSYNLVGTSNSPLNPLLSAAGNYGGPVATMALLAGSPAIHKGATVSGITADERGLPRPAVPDIGAFQTQAVASLAVAVPTAAIAGASFPVTITALDSFGNPVTNYSGAVKVASSDKQTVYVSAGAVNLVNGTATVGVTLDTSNTLTLNATSGKLTGTSASIVVSPAVTSFLVHAPTAATAGTTFPITITAVDRFGNPVTGYNGPVTLAGTAGNAEVQEGLLVNTLLIGSSAEVSEINTQGGALSTIVNTSSTTYNAIADATDGTFYVGAYGTVNAIYHYDQHGNYLGGFTLPSDNNQETPNDVVVVGNDVYVSSSALGIQEYTTSGTLIHQVAPNGDNFVGLAYDPVGACLYAVDERNNAVVRFDTQLDPGTIVVSNSSLASPERIAVGPDFNLYISSYNNNAIYKYDLTLNQLSEYASSGLDHPDGLTFDPQGRLDVASNSSNQIIQYAGPNSSGTVIANVYDPRALTIPSYVGTVEVTNLTNGSAQVTASLYNANPAVTLTASAGSIQGSSAAINVSPAAAAAFAVSAPNTVAAGIGFAVTLTAEDPYGNVATNYNGAVTLTSSDGQSVTLNPSTLAWNNGVASATATLNNANPSPVILTATAGSVSGSSASVVIEPAASAAISNGLAGLVNWAASQNFPLVGTSTSIQNALQLGLLNPVNAYLAQQSPTSPGFVTLLQNLSAQLGSLTVTVTPGSVQKTINGNQVLFSLDFQATETVATSLESLGSQADKLGIRLDPGTKISVTTSLNFNFTFAIDQTAGLSLAQAFFLNIPAGGLSASVVINAGNINSAIAIGFLGAQTSNGLIQLNAQASNASSQSDLSISGLQNLTLALSPTSSLNIALPLQATLGTQTASGTLTITDSNLATGASPTVSFQGFAGWQNFTTVGADTVMGLLNQLGSQLGQIGTKLWSTDLPFVNSLSLAQAANLEQAFQTEVTSRIASWSATAQRIVTDFNTAQDLANLLAQALDLSASQIGVHFDPTTSYLTYNLSLTSYTFSSLLSQALQQVNLNQGGLANASLTSSQLSLVPALTATLTVGVDLTPLGKGFVLSTSTPLSSLNGGAGVRINGSSADLQIALNNGTSFQVSLAGAKTVQDVINDIQTASNGQVVVTIDATSQQALDITEVTPPTGNGGTTFTVAAINNSYAAADLGIAGSDVGYTGTIMGQSLSGDSLQKHFFIEKATINASVAGTASQVNGMADLGAVALQMANGSGSVNVQGSMTLTNVTTLQQLTSALQGATSLGSLVTSHVSGSAQLNLPLQLAVPLAGVTLPSGARVAVNWTDITNPSTLTVTVTPALNLSNLTIAPVLQGLENVETFVQNAGAALLSQQLPGLGTSLAGVVNPVALLSAAVQNLSLNVPTTIDQLVSELSAALGQPVTASFTNDVLQLNLNYSFSTTTNVNLGFNLSPSLGSIADVNGSDPLSMTASGSVAVGLIIDLNQPSTPQYSVQDSSNIAVAALVNSSGISFNASVGPLGLSISDGSARLDSGTEGKPATWTVRLQPNTTNHLWPIATAASEITSTIVGQVNIVLPTFFPTPDKPLDPTTPNIELHVKDLSKAASTTTLIVPNVASALGSVSENDIMNQLVDGWDGVTRLLGSALKAEINTVNIPVIGSELEKALSFLGTMDSTVTQQLVNAPQLAATTIQNALYNSLGPQGLNWLVNLNPSDGATENDFVQLQQSNGSVHYLIQLHEGLTPLSIPLGVNLGLPGLGLDVNGNLLLNAGFDATLGFGLSQQYGFYVDTTDTASVGFNAQLDTSGGALATATLGFLQFNVMNNTPQTPLVSGGLTLGLNDVNGTQRLSVNDLTSSSTLNVGANANVDVNLHLVATIGGTTNLPHLSTDFNFVWSLDPTSANPNTLGFSNVTLDMGGFIDGLTNEIGQVLAPIEPVAQLLTTPLPIISQLAGHNFDLVDLASALGFCSPSTADFINAVATFVSDGGLNVPSSWNVGNFTLDPNAAANPADLGNLNPSSTNLNAPYSGNPITGFAVPILSNPSSAFQLLLGKDVPLVTYEMPQLQLNFNFDQFFPIIGPLGADLAGQIGAAAQFGFGFDTSGFRAYAADNFRDPGLILDGFYVSDRQNPDGTGPVVPQVQLYGSIAAYAALDLGIFEAGVGGGLFATVGFTVHDPSGTGKVHLEDLEADVQKGTIFDAAGALEAFLNAFVKIDIGFFSHTWTFDIANVTLGQIGEPAPSTPPVPQLATIEAGGVLRLNIGPYASQRLYGTTADGNETLTVTPGPNSNSVYVSGFGVTNQEFDNINEITGEGAAGNDTITINAGSNVNVNLAVGGGTNKFDVQSAGAVTLTGGAGNDTLEVDNATSADLIGGPGTEVLNVTTDSGPATLQAGNGHDALYGGSGTGQLLYGGSGTDLLVAGSGANQILHGGSGVSTLVAGSGAGQQLFGDSSTANLFGGTGNNQTLTAGSGNDYLYAGEANAVLIGGSGTDVLQVGWHLPTSGIVTFGNLPLGAIDPTTGQPLQVGWHLQESLTAKGWTVTNYTPGDTNQGAGYSYVMQAGTGDTLIIGGWGNDTIYGGSGTNTLYGGGGNGNKLLYAGVGATQMYGGGPGDNVSPSTGTHELFGGTGLDVLYGGDGCNITANATNTGLINAAGDSGDNGVNILLAGSGNSTLYGDSTGTNENTLIGGSGLDKLFAGGTSGDYLEAGSGVDSLYGGTGDDVFQLPFIAAGQPATTPDTMVGGFGLTTLVLKPVETEVVNGQLTQVSLTTDSDIYFNGVAGTTNQFQATLSDLDSGNLVGQIQFTLPISVERIALMGGLGDNVITVDPSVQRGMFLYGGPGHNILMSGSGNDDLVGGSGTSILEGGSGDDALYGGAIPAVYQQLINSLGSGSGGAVISGNPTSNALMTWLRQQPTGHNVLIAGSGNSQLYAGNGGDLMIGGNAQFNAQTGQFVLQPGAGRDVFEGGSGNDLMVGGVGSLGDVMLAGTGNDVLIGGTGEDVLEGPQGGGGRNDVMIGGSLINILMSNDTAGDTSYLLGGAGLNFEFGGGGNDQLFDYSKPNDPLQASAWSQVNSLAASYDLTLPPLASTPPANPWQEYLNFESEQNSLTSEVTLLNLLYGHPNQYGTVAAGSSTVSNLYFMKQFGNTTKDGYIVSGIDNTNLINGELVSGPGIPAGTTLSIPLDNGTPVPGEIALSNLATATGVSVALTFSDPMIVEPIWETGTLTKGSTAVSGLGEQTGETGTTVQGSATITHLANTQILAVGDTISGIGIPAGSAIVSIPDSSTIVLSHNATVTSSKPVALTISVPLTVGEPVTGTGIPAGTTIASVISGRAITLSNAATASSSAALLSFGSSPFAGPLVTGHQGDLPSGDSVASVISGSSIALAQNATASATSVQLTFSLTPQEEKLREALNNALQTIALGEANDLRNLGANTEIDLLQGGSGTNALYAGATPVWMVGTTGSDTFNITPQNDSDFASGLDIIEGSKSANDTLMFLNDGNIKLSYNSTTFSDVVTINNTSNNTSLAWVEGNNVSTVGVQTLGGSDTVTIGSPKFGSWTSMIRVVDGGFANIPGLQGNVVIDATAFTEQGIFLGGAGSDTIKISELAYGSLVQGGTGNNQFNELDVLGANGGSQVIEGIDPLTNQEGFQVNGVWLAGWVANNNFQKLVVVGGPGSNTFQTDGQISDVILEGGSGTNVLTAYNGSSSTLIGGSGSNTFTAAGGTSTLIGGAGQNTYNFTAAGVYNVIGGEGINTINAAAGTYTIAGGMGQNIYNFTGAGSYYVIGGAGQNSYYITSAGTYTLIGGSGANALSIQCQSSGDKVSLSQSGSVITVSGTISGSGLSVTASNMNSVAAYGSQFGDNTLDASGMTVGVSLVGYSYFNTLRGGAGTDTLIGGAGDDSLVAGNNSDMLYVSGYYSYYQGAGSNRLIYSAQPNDKVVVYEHGLSVNQTLESGTYSDGEPYTYLAGGTYYSFGSISGIGSIEVQDGTGTATARFAQEADVPAYESWSWGAVQTLNTWSVSLTLDNQDYSRTYFAAVNGLAWATGASGSWYVTDGSAVNWVWGSWVNNPDFPFNTEGLYFTVSGHLGDGGFLGLFPSSGTGTFELVRKFVSAGFLRGYVRFLGMRSEKRMARWLRASFHLGIGMVHRLEASRMAM